MCDIFHKSPPLQKKIKGEKNLFLFLEKKIY